MKLTWRIFWGVILIAVAVLLVLDGIGVVLPIASAVGEISVFAAVAGVLLLAMIVSALIKRRLSGVFFSLAFLFMLFEKNIAHLCGMAEENILNNWLVLLIALLFTVGLSILLPKQKWKIEKVFQKTIGKHGKGVEGGASVLYIDAANFTNHDVKCELGACTVHFINPEAYQGGGVLHIHNELGSVVVNVPAAWYAEVLIENELGAVQCSQTQNTTGPKLRIDGHNELGSVKIRYV